MLRKEAEGGHISSSRETYLPLSIWDHFEVFFRALRWDIQPGTACQGVAS